jgi:hypothetical protein
MQMIVAPSQQTLATSHIFMTSTTQWSIGLHNTEHQESDLQTKIAIYLGLPTRLHGCR